MNIQDICNQQWYLALYITGGKNRENLFDWLSDQTITPWTPLWEIKVPRSDKPHVFRKRISPVFPGYFFLKANFECHKMEMIRRHSAFCDFIKFGSQITPLKDAAVEALMAKYPDPTLNPAARDELYTASQTRLSKTQYKYLMQMDQTPHHISRTGMLLDMLRHAESFGF